MTEPDPMIAELTRRLAALEERVHMEAGLRASLDRDYSDVKAALAGHRRVLQAIGTTQGQHTQMLAELAGQLDTITVQVGGLSNRVDGLDAKVDAGFAEMRTGMAAITGLLTRLIEEDRGQDPA